MWPNGRFSLTPESVQECADKGCDSCSQWLTKLAATAAPLAVNDDIPF